MKSKRRIVESVTEIVLCFVLLGIIGVSFMVVTNLNPVTKPVPPVLGENTARQNFEFKQDDSFEQNNLVATANGFHADYNFAVSHNDPVSNFTLFTLNNTSTRTVKYQFVFSSNQDLSLFKLTATVGDKETVLFDPQGDGQMRALVVSMPANSSQDFGFKLNVLSESAAHQLSGSLIVQQL